MADDSELALLREIRDNQRVQLERQAEALAMQREQFELYRRQYDRAERLQERAEALQSRHAGTLGTARLLLWIVIPVLALLLGTILWPYLVAPWP